MPLEWKGIIKSGNLKKSPPLDTFGKSNRRWHVRYFVLYDPSILLSRTRSNASRYSVDFDSGLDELAPPPLPARNKRRKSSVIAENLLRRFRQDDTFDASDVKQLTLFYFENAEKEMQGAPPKNKINLENAKVTEGAPVNNNKWVINLETKDRLYYLCPETESDLYTWMEALNTTIDKQTNGEKTKRDSISEWTVASPKHKEPTPEVNNRLRDELDRMKLERNYDPQGAGHMTPQEPTLDFDFVQQSKSNKDSGIETGDELSSSTNFSTTGLKGYDPLPPAIKLNEEEEEEEEEEDVIYGNLIESPETHHKYQTSFPIEEDVYDFPPSTQQSNHQQHQEYQNHQQQQQLTEGEIYDCPPSNAQSNYKQQQYKQQQQLVEEKIPEQDEIYDCPPAPRFSPIQQQQQQQQQKQQYDEIYDCPPAPRFSPIQLSINLTDESDEIYDAPPSRLSTKITLQQQHHQQQQQQQQQQHDEIHDHPPTNLRLGKSIQEQSQNGIDEVYDCPSTFNDHAETDSASEMYDCLPSRPARCPQDETRLDSHRLPPNISVHSTQDDIYDCPPSTMNLLQEEQNGDEIYDSPPARQSALDSKQPLSRDDIYDCPPSSTYMTMISLNEESHDELYDCVPNRSGPPTTEDDIYDAPSPQRTLSQTIQMKSLPQEPPSQQFHQRTNSESIQRKGLPAEPQLLDYIEDETYDTPPSSRSAQDYNQGEELYESYQPVNNISKHHEPQAVFNRCREEGTKLPVGYNVVNNNDGAYDAIPQCFASKPLPLSPNVHHEQPLNDNTIAARNGDELYFEQNGKVFQKFTYR